ncbi:MAG: hypothetical protein IIX21_04615, partial [Clostridia bacterium]|nr:hypothetical protein [Clostridia bacterium]
MQNSLTKVKGLNKSVLQLLAVLTMVIDHTSIFVSIPSVYYIMRFIGRATIIIMCYFVAEGYHKTQNIGKYIIRMAVFAAISQIPYYLYVRWGAIPHNFNALVVDVFHTRNVIFSLFLGLSLLTVLKSEYNLFVKVLAMFAALHLGKYSDWGYWSVLWIVGFGLFYGSKKKQMIWLVAILLMRIVYTAIGPVIGILNKAAKVSSSRPIP